LNISRPLVLFGVLIAACSPATSAPNQPPAPNREVSEVQSGTPQEICAAAATPDPAGRSFSQAEQVTQPDLDYRAIFCTDAGPVYIDLLETETPITVNNFVFLAINHYFNNTTFHRVIARFMAQGGDPTGTGTGDPGYRFQDEFVKGLQFDRPGLLAMANSGPGTNGSQFFITTVPTPHLNNLHTIFGRVLRGQANVENIKLRDPASATEPGTILKTVVIIADPDLVETGATVVVTKADMVAAFDRLNELVASSPLEHSKVVLDTDQVIQSAPEAAREALGSALKQHHHQYRIASALNNPSCQLQNFPLMSAQYTLDAFESADDVSAALSDAALLELPLQNGYTEKQDSENLTYPIFKTQVTACDQPALRAMTYLQRGAFIATVEATISAESNGAAALDQVLNDAVALQIYESLFTDVLYQDIR
jgi:peptidylprolyl isomerase